MTNHQQTETILPIDDATAIMLYDNLYHRAVQLRTALISAADHAEVIGLPHPAQARSLLHNAYDLIWALSDATRKIHNFDRKRNRIDAAKRTGSAKPHQNAPDRTNAQHVDDPPSTDNLAKLDRQLQRHHT